MYQDVYTKLYDNLGFPSVGLFSTRLRKLFLYK